MLEKSSDSVKNADIGEMQVKAWDRLDREGSKKLIVVLFWKHKFSSILVVFVWVTSFHLEIHNPTNYKTIEQMKIDYQ